MCFFVFRFFGNDSVVGAGALALALLFLNSFTSHCSCALSGETVGFVQDELSFFFKRLFLLAAILFSYFGLQRRRWQQGGSDK